MAKAHDEAVEQLLEVVKQAIEDGRASRSEIEQWLRAAIALEHLAQEQERESSTMPSWVNAFGTLH